uniref:Ig-like domain-containing protein n=1 Tax=Pygocentrus nattereri TaxID=42514 RepID=A0AAR2JFT6_PYGNA
MLSYIFPQGLHYLKSLVMIRLTVLLLTALGSTSKVDISCLNGLKVIQDGENIRLNCSTSYSYVSAIAWFKQTPGENALLIASALGSAPQYHNDFDKSGRFIAARGESNFTLSISNAEPSDSATYYCSVTLYAKVALLGCTVLVLKGSSSSLSAVLQPPVSDPVELGGDTTLQCSILTDASAGDHSVYWIRHGSGESHPGIIYTHGNRSDECEKRSETDSPTQSCVYKLPKRNLSLSDAGTYYCAVLMCGEIIFGNGTKLDFEEKDVLDPTLLVLAASNIMSIAVVLFLCRKLHKHHHKGAAEGRTINQAEDTDVLNYAALSFAQSSSSRRSRTKNSSDQPVYAQVKTHQ